MSRRRRTSGAAPPAPPEPAGPSLASLPDPLIVRCLGLLAPRERLERAALVCRRFRHLCLAPELLESIKVTSLFVPPFPNTAGPPERLRALLALLTTHGRHVRRLELRAYEGFGPHTLLVAGCLAALGAAAAAGGRLEWLDVSHVPPLSADWLPALVHLTELKLYCSMELPLVLPAGISRLTALQAATLMASPLELKGPRLPAALARLMVSDSTSTQLPPQLSTLGALSSLSLVRCPYEAASVACLSALPSLRHLVLSELPPGCLPAYLAAATRLERLEVGSHAGVYSAAFSSPLHDLCSLTCLALSGRGWLEVPAGISRLTRLQRLCLIPSCNQELSNGALPGGPWLSHIAWLGLPWECLEAAAAGPLRAAPRLRFLCSYGLPAFGKDLPAEQADALGVAPSYYDRFHAFWAWAAAHPPLQVLGFEQRYDGEAPSIELLDAMLELKHRRPGLVPRRIDDDPGFCSEMLEDAEPQFKPCPHFTA
ncbi:hypothetical protein ABPG75_012088 [Micractinium tetrahymenae]